MRLIPNFALAATVFLAALTSCTTIDLTQEQTHEEEGSGCCNTCGNCCNTCETTKPPTTCSCPKGYTLTPAGDACFKETVSEPTQGAVTYKVCKGDTKSVYGKLGAKVESGGTAPGVTTEPNSYWGDGATPLDGRLNEVGIWTCDTDPTTTDRAPLDEWIGFSLCATLEEGGDYILGIAGDNRVRLDIDGTNVFLLDSNSTDNFTYWHLLPIHLTSGPHILELRGRNDELIAAFGAEISGPFPPGSLTTDAAVLDEAAYQEKLVWSTGKLKDGKVFDLGERSGWQCPGETALDLCADKPLCKHIDYLPCEETRATPAPAATATAAPATGTKK